MSKLSKRNCYSCVHHRVCSFGKGMERLLRDHMGWYDVDMPAPPDWQRLYETLAKACLRYEFTEGQ
jgi:hypothetical protein